MIEYIKSNYRDGLENQSKVTEPHTLIQESTTLADQVQQVPKQQDNNTTTRTTMMIPPKYGDNNTTTTTTTATSLITYQWASRRTHTSLWRR